MKDPVHPRGDSTARKEFWKKFVVHKISVKDPQIRARPQKIWSSDVISSEG